MNATSGATGFMTRLDERLPDRVVWAIMLALLAVHVILVWQSREIGLISAQDDGRYMLLARSLREFDYRDIYLIGLPYHSSYPPFFPTVLAAWSIAFGEGFAGFVVLNVGLSAAALTLAFLSIRRAWSGSGALLCLACMVVNPFLVMRPGGVRSETLYMALSFLALWVLAARRPSARMMWVAGTAAILAALTRTVGLSLIAAIGIVLIVERRYRPLLAFGVAAAITAGAWLAWSATAPDQVVGYSYFADALNGGAVGLASALGRRVAEMLPNYTVLTLPWVLAVPTIPGTPIDNAVGSGLVLLGVAVGMVSIARRWPVAVIYMLLYGALLVVWPYHRPRFMEPLIPLLLAMALLGIGSLASRVRTRWAIPVVAVTAAVLFVGGVLRTADLRRSRMSCGEFSLADPPECLQQDRASLLRAIAYIDRHTPEDALFVTAKPEALFYYANRRSVLLQATLAESDETYVDDLRERGVSYVLLGSLHTDELGRLEPRLTTQCAELRVEAFFPPRTYLFAISDSTASTDVDACRALEDYRAANVDRNFLED